MSLRPTTSLSSTMDPESEFRADPQVSRHTEVSCNCVTLSPGGGGFPYDFCENCRGPIAGRGVGVSAALSARRFPKS